MSAREDVLLSAIARRYARRGRAEHGRIPDDFATVTLSLQSIRCGCPRRDGPASGGSDRGLRAGF